MTTKLPFTLLPGQTEYILNFVNTVQKATDISDNKDLQDDASYNGAGGYSIGQKTAKELIKHRNNLPANRFRTVEQILEVQGIGHDKIRDILSSFWQSAETAFYQQLTTEVLFENWKVEHWSFDFENDIETFENLVNSKCALREFIAEKIKIIVQEKHQNWTIANLASTLIQHLPCEKYDLPIASSHLFALWWYAFDQDNWFSFEKILSVTTAYLDYYPMSGMDLVLFKDFENGGTLSEAVSVTDLPVILNHGERKITIWAASLYD